MKQKGFTLIELIIVIFIIGLISTISVANFRAAEKQKRAAIAADTVTNALRNAQNFTLAGKLTTNANSACRTPQYYYVTFQYQTQISLYAYDNCNTVDLAETYSLPPNSRVQASGLKLDSTAATTSLSVYFTPPFAAIQAARDSNGKANFTTATITVENTDGSASKTVTVDGVAGRIE